MTRMLVWLALAALPAAAGAGEWQVDTKATDNQVQYTSEVVTHAFSGTTDQVDGFVYWPGQNLFAGGDSLRFEVDLRTLDSGIGKRDRDMRDVLATDRWPKAIFAGHIAGNEPMDSTVTAYRVTAAGTLSFHGVERPVELPGTLVVGPDDSTVRTSFTLLLKDYNIEAPSLAAFIKVSQEIGVSAFVHLKHVR